MPGFKRYSVYRPYVDRVSASNMIRAVSRGHLQTIEKFLLSGLSPNISNGDEDSLLHIAVEKENLKVMKLLLNQSEIEASILNNEGQTPFITSIGKQNIKLVKCLMWKVTDNHLQDSRGRTPLHIAVCCPKIARFLVKHGADINIPDNRGNTPLHTAVKLNETETLCMLLYYNADANIEDEDGIIPYEQAFRLGRSQLEGMLANYTIDTHLRHVALKKRMISVLQYRLFTELQCRNEYSGAYVKHLFDFMEHIRSPNVDAFKMLWNSLECFPDDEIPFELFLQFDNEVCEMYLKVIVDSSNNFPLKYVYFVNRFSSSIVDLYEKEIDNDIVTKFICCMLANGWIPHVEDLRFLFYYFGDTELFRLLPYIDYTGSFSHPIPRRQFLGTSCVLRFIFDIHTSIKDIKSVPQANVDFKRYLKFCADRQLMHKCKYYYPEDVLPTVPKLVELARDVGRQHIVNSFKIQTTCQYHTIVDHLDIPKISKRILKFEKKLYCNDSD